MCLFSARRGHSFLFWIPHAHSELKTSHGRSNLATRWSYSLKSQCSSQEKAHQSLFHSIMLLCAVVIFSVLAGETCLFYLITTSFDLKLLELHLSDHKIIYYVFFQETLLVI